MTSPHINHAVRKLRERTDCHPDFLSVAVSVVSEEQGFGVVLEAVVRVGILSDSVRYPVNISDIRRVACNSFDSCPCARHSCAHVSVHTSACV